MNTQNIAIRCARTFLSLTETDPTKWSAIERELVADALTTGISEYWSLAPQYVVAPESLTGFVLANGASDYALPLGFQQVTRPIKLRATGSTDAWRELRPVSGPPNQALSGFPLYYQVMGTIPDAPIFNGGYLGGPDQDFTLRFYPAADKAYDMDLGIQYQCPVVRMRHLTGADTIELPIPEVDCITNVVPLCGPAFAALPFSKKPVDMNSINAAFTAAARRMAMKPPRLTRTPARCGTPVFY